MSTTDDHNAVRQFLLQLRTPITDLATLLTLLTAPLGLLGLLPPQFRRFHQDSSLPKASIRSKHIPLIQEAILLHIIPAWEPILRENDSISLVEQYFCPDAFWFSTPEAGNVALHAYSTILSLSITSFSLHLLAKLTRGYPIDRLYQAVFDRNDALRSGLHMNQKATLEWEDCVQNVVSVPAKVSNAAFQADLGIPQLLEHGVYLNNLCVRSEELIYTLACAPLDQISAIAHLLSRLANLPFQQFGEGEAVKITTDIPRSALLTSISFKTAPDRNRPDPSIKDDALLLKTLVGPLNSLREEIWTVLATIMLSREWSEAHARILVCWAAGTNESNMDEDALAILLDRIVDTWSSSDHIKYSLLSQHQYVTSLLLLTVSYFSPSSSHLTSLARSSAFISAISVYISHMDHAVRRCGMLAAEIVAQRTGRKLDFGDWDGDGQGRPWARALRLKLEFRDIDALVDSDLEDIETVDVPKAESSSNTQHTPPPSTNAKIVLSESAYDSDDSLVGYASESSSRSASPTPSDLEEIEKDPTLNVGVPKVPRPVYLAQLGELLRSTSGKQGKDDPHDADKIEMGLNCAEELIRRKRNFGIELEENAANLVFALIGLQDNYNLDGFDHKRQAALNALVACSPRKAAPAIIEQFFGTQYSISQRFVMLNALAIGARELASLPVPPTSSSTTDKSAFPSKLLPGPLHQKYLAAGGQDTLLQLTDGITRLAIDRSKADGDKVPEIVREKRLRINQTRVTEVDTTKRTLYPWQAEAPSKPTTFTEVAAEFFIVPFINRFWQFFRDEQTREERTAQLSGRGRYYGAGTGLILNPLVLSQMLNTVAILVHASQNAPEWLAIIAPDALELALTLGTRPISHMDDNDDIEEVDETSSAPGGKKEAAVLSACLGLALAILDGCNEVDGGRTMGLDHTALLIGTGEWAGTVFSRLEDGVKAQGGGGIEEVRLRRTAASVVLKVDEITSKWRRSMVDAVHM
ncbi:hypothetical protein ONZ45_g5285 [Pleurotus djamor]|nr:hypothetical protein ONZ45_g5285 [Pleurotus djamor]